MGVSDDKWDRLERLVTGRGTPEELAALARWVEETPELQALADGMRTAGQVPGEDAPIWDQEAGWRQVSRRVRWFARPLGSTRRLHSRRLIRWAVAATVLVAVGSTVYLIELRRTADRERIAAAAPPREVLTRRGERATFKLVDGTKVILGPETRLTIPASYGRAGAGRELSLEGEGFFNVVPNQARLFKVHTWFGTATDLGTDFSVTTYAEARGMQVVVTSGRVAVQPHGAAADSVPLVVLAQGDLVRLDSAGIATVTRVAPASYVAWTEGSLVFDATPLRQVLPRLARWYDLDIRLADSTLGNRRLTYTFRDQSVTDVLDLIALSLNLRIRRDGSTVTLYPSS